jgi:hypothetical protein
MGLGMVDEKYENSFSHLTLSTQFESPREDQRGRKRHLYILLSFFFNLLIYGALALFSYFPSFLFFFLSPVGVLFVCCRSLIPLVLFSLFPIGSDFSLLGG